MPAAEEATAQKQELFKYDQKPGDAKQGAEDKDKNTIANEQQQDQANEGEYEYYDEEDYGDENAHESPDKKG